MLNSVLTFWTSKGTYLQAYVKNPCKWVGEKEIFSEVTEVQCSYVSSLTSSDLSSKGVTGTLIWDLDMQ